MKWKLPLLLICMWCLLYSALAAAESTSRDARSQSMFGITGHIAPVSIVFPLQKGLSAYYVISPNWLAEVEYRSSSIGVNFTVPLTDIKLELGEVKEQYYTFQTRYFPGTNSFNLIMGFGYRSTEASIPEDWVDLALGDKSLTLTKLSAKYFQLGLSNYWQWDNGFTLGCDWLLLSIPFDPEVEESVSRYAKNEEFKSDIETVESAVSWLPAVLFTNISVGYTF